MQLRYCKERYCWKNRYCSWESRTYICNAWVRGTGFLTDLVKQHGFHHKRYLPDADWALCVYYRPFQPWLPYWFNGWVFCFYWELHVLKCMYWELHVHNDLCIFTSWNPLMVSLCRQHEGQLCSRSLHWHYRYAFRPHRSSLRCYAHMSNQCCYLSRSHGTCFAGRVNRLVSLCAQQNKLAG